MNICGLQKTTLLDFPGHVAAVVFTGGCNFQCPFCHNSSLISGPGPDQLEQKEVLAFLNRRRSILQGLCITGGEPTLQPDLEDFIRAVRALGLKIKLDTNGYRPQVLKDLCRKGLIDYVAMDIKAGKEHYKKASGLEAPDMERISGSIAFLLEDHVPYEFRTTAVKGIHTAEDFRQIGSWIQGASAYFIQNFTDNGQVLRPGIYESFSPRELMDFADLVRPSVSQVSIRGVDVETTARI